VRKSDKFMLLEPLKDYFPCACAWQKYHIEAWKKWSVELGSNKDPTQYIKFVPDCWKYKYCAETLLPCSPWFHYHIPEEQTTLFTKKYLDLVFSDPRAMKTYVMQTTYRVPSSIQPLLQHTIMTEYKHSNWLIFPIASRPIREPFCINSQCISLTDAFYCTNKRVLVEWVSKVRYTGPPSTA
jgi:hypothetical protein